LVEQRNSILNLCLVMEADKELVAMAPKAWALLSQWHSVWDAPRGQVHPPALSREGVTPLLKLAASSVAVLQEVIDHTHLSSTPPFGASRELLVTAVDGSPLGAALPDPVQDPVGFVRALVLASFQTGDGEHPEPLSKQYLTNLLNQHCAKQLTLAGLLVEDPHVALREALAKVGASMEGLLSTPLQKGDLSSSAKCLQLSQRLERLAADTAVVTADLISQSQTGDAEMTDVEGPDVAEGEPETTDVDDDAPLKRTKSQVVKALQVERVTKSLKERRDPVHELRRTASLLAGQDVPNDQRPLQEALETVTQAQKRARNFGEDLIEDMLALDKLSGLTQEDRNARKAAIAGIEQLLEDVDASKGRFAKLQRALEGKLKEQEETAATERAAAEQAAAAEAAETLRKKQDAAKAAIQKVLQAAPPGQDFWNKVRLPLRFHSQEKGDGYLIHATIPGLQSEDIRIQLSDDNTELTVAGLRFPSMQEYRSMKQKLTQRLQELAKSKQLAAQVAGLDVNDLYAEMGQDAFGKFSETFSVPEDADVDSMDAQYNDGVISVFIPKILRAPFGSGNFAPGRYHGGHSRYDHPGLQGLRQPGGAYPGLRGQSAAPGLFGGRDPAFFW